MNTRIFFGVLVVGIVGLLASGTSAYALEHEIAEMVEGGMQVTVDPVSAEAQEAAALQEIAQQVQELEAEVNRLSLAVSKYVLEQQALALQQQLLQGASVAIAEEAEPEDTEEVVEPVAVAQESNASDATVPERLPITPNQEERLPESPNTFEELDELPAPIVATDEPEEGQGFFARVQSAIGGLGTPEFVTVFILAVLAIFVIARRTASRVRKQPTASVASSPKTAQLQSQQALDEQRQELQERVAWK